MAFEEIALQTQGTFFIGVYGPRFAEYQVLFLACFLLLVFSLCINPSLLSIDLRPVAPLFRDCSNPHHKDNIFCLLPVSLRKSVAKCYLCRHLLMLTGSMDGHACMSE